MSRLDTLNAAARDAFVEKLGSVFEHSPWVAEAVVERRPFASVDALHEAMCAAVREAGSDAQLTLIRAHPELAGRAAIRGELTAASQQEQRGAGLDQCSAEEFARLHALNDAYRQRFGFPFIIAVRGHDRHSIMQAMQLRLGNERDAEIAEAMRQIERIAALRLADMLTDPTATL